MKATRHIQSFNEHESDVTKSENFLNKNPHLVEVIPNKYVYHTSNLIFRKKISKGFNISNSNSPETNK
jgi:hypothetical protein